jgi:hypothetical protein
MDTISPWLQFLTAQFKRLIALVFLVAATQVVKQLRLSGHFCAHPFQALMQDESVAHALSSLEQYLVIQSFWAKATIKIATKIMMFFIIRLSRVNIYNI